MAARLVVTPRGVDTHTTVHPDPNPDPDPDLTLMLTLSVGLILDLN